MFFPGDEVDDYSGEFNPSLGLGHFPKDALIDMRQAVARNVHWLDGLWRGDPVSAGVMKIEREVKSSASGILALKQCRTLRQCEKHGLADLQDHNCEDLDARGFEIPARQCSPEPAAQRNSAAAAPRRRALQA